MPGTWISIRLRSIDIKETLQEMVAEDQKTNPEVTLSSFVRKLIRDEYYRRRNEKHPGLPRVDTNG